MVELLGSTLASGYVAGFSGVKVILAGAFGHKLFMMFASGDFDFFRGGLVGFKFHRMRYIDYYVRRSQLSRWDPSLYVTFFVFARDDRSHFIIRNGQLKIQQLLVKNNFGYCPAIIAETLPPWT